MWQGCSPAIQHRADRHACGHRQLTASWQLMPPCPVQAPCPAQPSAPSLHHRWHTELPLAALPAPAGGSSRHCLSSGPLQRCCSSGQRLHQTSTGGGSNSSRASQRLAPPTACFLAHHARGGALPQAAQALLSLHLGHNRKGVADRCILHLRTSMRASRRCLGSSAAAGSFLLEHAGNHSSSNHNSDYFMAPTCIRVFTRSVGLQTPAATAPLSMPAATWHEGAESRC